jgi:predicted nucleic acid-binding Zn ribbon protein
MLLYPYDDTKSPTTVTYARYLYSVHHKMKLDVNVHVDHIDGDRTNDLLSNLQLLQANQNKLKFRIDNNIKPNMAHLRCPECDVVFIREKRNTHLSKGGNYTACSRTCSGTISRALQINKHPVYSIEELRKRIESNVINVYENYNGGYAVVPQKHQLEDWKLFTYDYPESIKEPTMKKYCVICGTQLHGTQTKSCSIECDTKNRKAKRTFEIPSFEELTELLSKMSADKLGVTYGVSGNAVRKWLKRYKKKLTDS